MPFPIWIALFQTSCLCLICDCAITQASSHDQHLVPHPQNWFYPMPQRMRPFSMVFLVESPTFPLSKYWPRILSDALQKHVSCETLHPSADATEHFKITHYHGLVSERVFLSFWDTQYIGLRSLLSKLKNNFFCSITGKTIFLIFELKNKPHARWTPTSMTLSTINPSHLYLNWWIDRICGTLNCCCYSYESLTNDSFRTAMRPDESPYSFFRGQDGHYFLNE